LVSGGAGFSEGLAIVGLGVEAEEGLGVNEKSNCLDGLMSDTGAKGVMAGVLGALKTLDFGGSLEVVALTVRPFGEDKSLL
jgi:hypothetical protein